MSIANIKEYVESFGIFGEPVKYGKLNLSPILMKDAHKFNENFPLLCIDKNKLGSPELIQKSYLLFLLEIMQLDPKALESFVWIFEKVLSIKFQNKLFVADYPKDTLLTRKSLDTLTDIYTINGREIAFEVSKNKASVYFGEVRLTANQFNEIRRCILYQNLIDYDDSPMSEDVRKYVEKYYALKNKGIRQPSLEDKLLAVISNSSETRESIKTMPYRQFSKLVTMICDKIEYSVEAPLLPYLENQKIEHWFYKKNKNKFESVFKDIKEIQNKHIS